MKKAIKALEYRIGKLNEGIAVAEKAMEEPEMVCDIEFASNDIANYELEIMELQKAIEILNTTKSF